VREWFLDPTASSLVVLVLELEGTSYELRWPDLVRDAEGGWRTPRLLSELPLHTQTTQRTEPGPEPQRPPERPHAAEEPLPTG
jgi:hypothetical protein